jgi:hypothetical protein
LTVLGFYADDKLVAVVELSGEEVLFSGVGTSFGELDAVFIVARPEAGGSPFVLTAAE